MRQKRRIFGIHVQRFAEQTNDKISAMSEAYLKLCQTSMIELRYTNSLAIGCFLKQCHHV